MPQVIVTDKPSSHGAVRREAMPSVEHRLHKGLDDRAGNGHQPTRQRERAMKGSRGVGGAQRFLAASSGIPPHLGSRRHLMTAPGHRAEAATGFATRDRITSAADRPTTV